MHVIHWLRRLKMKATNELNWKLFFTRLYGRFLDTDILSHSAQVAFYFSFALFPLLFFLVSLFGLFLGTSGELRDELFSYLRQIMPVSVFHLVVKTVEETVGKSSGGKLALGLVITLWSASAGVDAIRNALNEIYRLKETRYWWRTKLESIALTFLVAIFVAVILGIVFYGWQLVGIALASVGIEVTSPWVLVGIQWLSILLVMLLACEVIYNLLPNFKEIHWIWITPGSLIAIFLWIISTNAFRLYLGYYNNYSAVYGSLGAVMILMLWLYLTALALMVGGTINSVIHEITSPVPKPSEHA